jgi:predicted NAD/FAD-binding protein
LKICIIGTGISGNVVSRLLAQEHQIEVFEAERCVGGHANTSNVCAFGKEWSVDTGFMVYNERTYPNFCRLLQLLDVTGRNTDMSFSVSCEQSGLEFQGSSFQGMFAQRWNLFSPAFLRMLWDILRFNRNAGDLLQSDLGDRPLGDVLGEAGYGKWFADKYLVPMAAAIWSCPPGRLLEFPAHFLLAFLRNHGLLQLRDRPEWKTVLGGARRYVTRLVAPFRDRVRTDCPIESVRRHEDHVVVRPRKGPAEVFDVVVLACHADEALALLEDADHEEQQVLEAFPYQRNLAILHTDTAILPQNRRAWASWNYHIADEDGLPVAVTYDLSRLQGLDTPSPLLLTLNPGDRIRHEHVLDQFTFRHPVFTRNSQRAQNRMNDLNGRRCTYFCGAYLGYGFHEDGVKSALNVTGHFGLGLEQWKAASTTASFDTSACSP